MPPSLVVVPEVTEVFQTISIIEQIAVDTLGNTIGIITYTTSYDDISTSDESLTPSLSPSPTPVESPQTTSVGSSVDETSYSSSSNNSDPTSATFDTIIRTTASEVETEPAPSPQPSPAVPSSSPSPADEDAAVETDVAASPKVPSFATLSPGQNATDTVSEVAAIVTLSDGSLYTSTSTSASDSTTISSSTTSASSSSSNEDSDSEEDNDDDNNSSRAGFASFKFCSSRMSSSIYVTSTSVMTVSDPSATPVGGSSDFGSGVVGAPIGGGGAPASGLEGNNGSNDATTPTPPGVVAGSVIGGLAGVAVLGFLIMMFLRWRKRKGIRLSISSGNNILPPSNYPDASGSVALPMVERQSIFSIPAFAFYKRNSDKQRALGSESTGEKGFVKVSGRKLPSVLQHGGNGYEAPAGSVQHDQSQSGEAASYYRDDQGFYSANSIATAGRMSTSQPSSPQRNNNNSSNGRQLTSAFATSASLDNPFLDPEERNSFDGDKPIYREGPGRQPSFTPISPAKRNTPPHFSALKRPDYLGRSHPSRDGSRHSKFQEDV